MYTLYEVLTSPDTDLGAVDGFTPIENDMYEYNYETEPMFGSPTQYNGLAKFVNGLLIIAPDEHGGKPKNVKRHIEDSINAEFEPVELTIEQQYELMGNNDGGITRISHPKYPEERIGEIARMKDLQGHSNANSDDVREEAIENQYQILTATLHRNGDFIKVDFRSTCSFSDLPRADTDELSWVIQTIEPVL